MTQEYARMILDLYGTRECAELNGDVDEWDIAWQLAWD